MIWNIFDTLEAYQTVWLPLEFKIEVKATLFRSVISCGIFDE